MNDKVDKIVVTTTSGAVSVVQQAGGPITLRRSVHYRGRQPDLVQTVVDGVLTLSVQCKGGTLSQCKVDEQIEVPADVAVEVHTGSGDVSLEKVQASVTVTTTSGKVMAIRLGGKVGITTGNGDVTLDALTNEATIQTGSGRVKGTHLSALRLGATTLSGKVDLTFERSPDRVEARTGSGAITVTVPKAAYDVAPRTSGKLSVAGTNGKDAAGRQILATSDSGNVTVRGL